MLFHYLGGGLAISFTLLWQLPGQNRTLRIQKPFEWGSSIQEREVVGMGGVAGKRLQGGGDGSGGGARGQIAGLGGKA